MVSICRKSEKVSNWRQRPVKEKTSGSGNRDQEINRIGTRQTGHGDRIKEVTDTAMQYEQ